VADLDGYRTVRLPVTKDILKTCMRFQINEAMEPDYIRDVARGIRKVAKFYQQSLTGLRTATSDSTNRPARWAGQETLSNSDVSSPSPRRQARDPGSPKIGDRRSEIRKSQGSMESRPTAKGQPKRGSWKPRLLSCTRIGP